MAQFTTVQDIYQTVCYVLLEDNGLQLGIVTEQQFLDNFAAVFLEFLQKTGICSTIFTQQINFGQPQYEYPPDMIQVRDCFVGGKHISRETLEELDNAFYNWRSEVNNPRRWHEDGLPIKTIELSPTPNYTGTAYSSPAFLTQQPPYGVYGVFNPADNNLTIVGTQGTIRNTFALNTIVPIIPDSFTCYLGYGVLNKIFSSNSEAKDDQRAAYTGARFNEGIQIASTISGQMNNNG